MSDPILSHRLLVAPEFLQVDPSGPEGAAHEASNAANPAADRLPAPESREPILPGQALADVLAAGLVRLGWSVDHRWTTYTSHALEARHEDRRFDVEAQLVGYSPDAGVDLETNPGRWSISAKRRSGFFKRLFAGAVSDADRNELAVLRANIDASLAADSRSGPALAASGPWVDEATASQWI